MRRTQPEPETQQPVYDTRTTLAAWKCRECGVCRAGFIDPHDFKTRRCMNVPRGGNHGHGRICGGAMIEVYREDAK